MISVLKLITVTLLLFIVGCTDTSPLTAYFSADTVYGHLPGVAAGERDAVLRTLDLFGSVAGAHKSVCVDNPDVDLVVALNTRDILEYRGYPSATTHRRVPEPEHVITCASAQVHWHTVHGRILASISGAEELIRFLGSIENFRLEDSNERPSRRAWVTATSEGWMVIVDKLAPAHADDWRALRSRTTLDP